MMNTNIIALASELSDRDLLARLPVLAGGEREATVELLAHLAALDVRPSLYAAEGHGSLFTYCTQVLHLSEDAACNRIHAARACRRFPVLLDLLATGALSVTTVRLLREHLTPENHEAVIARASGRSRREIDLLVAELAPRPDVPSSVRKLPMAPSVPPPTPASAVAPKTSTAGVLAAAASTDVGFPEPERTIAPVPAARRPIVEPTSPARYRVQFTVGQETRDKLRRLQDLLRRDIPDGDPGAIFDRAVALLLEKVEKQKLGAAVEPRPSSIRPGTDREAWETLSSRDIPRHVRREAWRRDGGQCAYVGSNGHRCAERTFLEFHHIVPYARGGRATLDNISLRCRRHNQYEAELVFGSHDASRTRERRVPALRQRQTSGPDRPVGATETRREVWRTGPE